MNSIKNYEIDREVRYREIQAEFERCWREQVNKANGRSLPLIDRLIMGLSCITLGIIMIAQAFVG